MSNAVCLFSYCRSFMEKALTEVDRFKKQRTVDLKEIFINYAILQIKISKRVRTFDNKTLL